VEAAGGTWQTRRSITFSSFAPRYVWSIPNIMPFVPQRDHLIASID
jgi:hypothetical protein